MIFPIFYPSLKELKKKEPVTPLKLVEVKTPSPLSFTRQMSIQSTTSIGSRIRVPNTTSSSVAPDDLMDESSMRSMMALEDMRGEPQGNRFTRGLRNLRYVGQNVLYRKSFNNSVRSRDSLDEESCSDLDSIHSSNWSIIGSDSTEVTPSQQQQQQRIGPRRKRFRRKQAGEGMMAAMLIRSVHATVLPLDSVKEDRETPTPSPVNLTDEATSVNQETSSVDILAVEAIRESEMGDHRDTKSVKSSTIVAAYNKFKDDQVIPMISSSESDTSTDEEEQQAEPNEEDDADEGGPSESSTNYNILDDTISLLDLSSSSENDDSPRDAPDHHSSTSFTHLALQLSQKSENEAATSNLIDILSSPSIKDEKKINYLSSEFSSDIDSDLPLKIISSERPKRVRKISNSSRSKSCVDSDKKKKVPPPLKMPENDEESPVQQQQISSPASLKSARHHQRLHKQQSLILDELGNNSESSGDEYYPKHHVSRASSKNHLLINLSDDDDEPSQSVSLADGKVKISRKVERTDTVIYKGPKEKSFPEASNAELEALPPAAAATIQPKLVVPRSPTSEIKLLQLPSPTPKDIAPKSPYPVEDRKSSEFVFPDEEKRVAEILTKKYRQSCMSDLIKMIDSRMLAHHHHHHGHDSLRRRRLATSSRRLDQTPSPESTHRRIRGRSRSRSPESTTASGGHHHHSHHHHHHHATNLHSSHSFASSMHQLDGSHSRAHKSHHNSSESIVELAALSPRAGLVNNHSVVESQPPPLREELDDELEQQQQPLKVLEKAPDQSSLKAVSNSINADQQMLELQPLMKSIINSTSPLTTNTNNNNSNNNNDNNNSAAGSEAFNYNNIITNNSNETDNSCVSQSSPIRRQQSQQQKTNQSVDQQQQISPATSNGQSNAKVIAATSAHSPAGKNPVLSGVSMHRRSSDSDLSITPKGNSLTGSDRSMGGYLKATSGATRTMNQEALEMLEYPFITMQQYPPGFVLHIGGLVSARSVKLLERISNLEEPEGRDAWWTEIRMEVRSHARALACNVVIGYKEETSICDDVCVLSGSGTAAVISLHSTGQDHDNVLITHVQGPMTASLESDKGSVEKNIGGALANKAAGSQVSINQLTPASAASAMPSSVASAAVNASTANNHHNQHQQQQQHRSKQRNTSESNEHEAAYSSPPSSASACGLCHLPYNKSSVNFQVNVSKCAVCRRAKVPDVLFTTVELPENVPMTGRGCFIQATVSKAKKDLRGELNAKEISDCLPFLEYELHSLLLNKLRMRGMNAVFGLKIQVSIGERLVIGMAVGTAVYLTALPAPSLPQINTGNSWHDEEQLAEMQKSLVDTVKKNMEYYQLKPPAVQDLENGRSMSDTDESEDELPELDLGLGMKDVCVLEVDDLEDMDRISLLMDERPPSDFHVVNTETIPGLEDLEIVRNLQMFTQVSRAKIPSGQSTSMPSKYFARLLQTIYFKLRRMVPCALCDLQFRIAMPEQDEIQLSVIGMALGLGEPTKSSIGRPRRRLLSHSVSKDQMKRADNDNDMIFCLDEDHHADSADSNAQLLANNATPTGPNLTAQHSIKQRPRSPLRMKHTVHRHKHVPLKERYGVDITPLSYLPGGRIERYLGNLNFFFIRESNSIRENGGLSGFIHSFVTEVLAIVRAHVTALGGNAMVAFFMTQCVLLHSPHKNQGQCLINVGGDVVSVSYFGNDKLSQAHTQAQAHQLQQQQTHLLAQQLTQQATITAVNC
ncbi:uncharacterized protein LOC106652114 isoform X2 [Trichogramma pretiosum]|uniref:uncharacterized protein LOC106652114 isoform X2 n=1 Tax=Trichogramma pretiosum TaxID=7493 RepID=UPI000C71A655|nr:uncharacterized protein LOC106652114 isoform X2 [Trichogramma pretiosum]